MPIRPPALDDRSFDDLVAELVARIPAHTPEWTNPRLGDPGRTLIELFAWLGDTLLYRANLIPERQRLAFLRLLGVPLRPAIAARGLVGIEIDDDRRAEAITIRPLATVQGPVSFETRDELTLLPVTAECYYKRPLPEEERGKNRELLAGLRNLYDMSADPQPYYSTPLFPGGAADPAGFDLVAQSLDRCLYIALLARKPALKEATRAALGANTLGGRQAIAVGVMPAIETPALFAEIGSRARIPHIWELSSVDSAGNADYISLDVLADSSLGLTCGGVVRLALPPTSAIAAPKNDVRELITAGVGDNPPRLDDPATAERLVAWLRLRPTPEVERLSLSWVGINAVEIDQRQTSSGQIVGVSNGRADQEFQLPGSSVEPETLLLQVEEEGAGYQLWERIDDLALASHAAAVYRLESEGGTVQFGNGVWGRIPASGARIRVARMRAGGGRAGNLQAGALSGISAFDLQGRPVSPKLLVQQGLPTEGGEDVESLADAERRIPALFRHRDRAVTADDYRSLAAITPGVRVGRVVVLPRFKPQQRRFDVPGVVSVMVLPDKPGFAGPNPRADRPFLEAVHAQLDQRRPLAAELYVIGAEYVPLGAAVGIGLREGVERNAVLLAVREALRRFLWPLPPGGVEEGGWELGRTVRDRELEVVVARAPGVATVDRVNLFRRDGSSWTQLLPGSREGQATLALQPWQLPELLSVVVIEGLAPDNLRAAPNPFAAAGAAVPLVPEVC
jgi:predicted phage baseplate assembly protein